MTDDPRTAELEALVLRVEEDRDYWQALAERNARRMFVNYHLIPKTILFCLLLGGVIVGLLNAVLLLF